MSIITITNKKGGVGKTTSAISLSCICAALGKKTLLIDVDPQCNSSRALGQEVINHADKGFNTWSLLQIKEKLTTEEYLAFISQAEFDNLYCLPCDPQLERYLEEMIKDEKTDYSLRLLHAVEAYKPYFDFIFIDTTPFFCLLSEIAIVPSDYVIAPLQVEGFSYDGLEYLIEKIHNVKVTYKLNTMFKGFFLTCVNPRTNDFKGFFQTYTENFEKYFLCSFIRRDNKMSNISYRSLPLEIQDAIVGTKGAKKGAKKIIPLKTLFTMNPTPNAIHDYKKLLIELDILEDKDARKIIKEIRMEEKEELRRAENRKTLKNKKGN